MTSPDEKQEQAFISSGLSQVHLSDTMNSVKLDFLSAITPGEMMCIVLPADSLRPIRELLEQMEKEIVKRSLPPSGRH